MTYSYNRLRTVKRDKKRIDYEENSPEILHEKEIFEKLYEKLQLEPRSTTELKNYYEYRSNINVKLFYENAEYNNLDLDKFRMEISMHNTQWVPKYMHGRQHDYISRYISPNNFRFEIIIHYHRNTLNVFEIFNIFCEKRFYCSICELTPIHTKETITEFEETIKEIYPECEFRILESIETIFDNPTVKHCKYCRERINCLVRMC